MTSAAHFRRAEPADADAISALAIATFALGCPPDTDPQDIAEHVAHELTPERFRMYIADPAATVLVAEVPAEDHDALAGYAIFISGEAHPLIPASAHSEVEGGPCVEVRKFYVDPRFHGAGIAAELMRRELELHADAAAIWLSVNDSNRRAQMFYAKFGFAVIGTQQYRVGDDLQDDLVMCRPPNREAQISHIR